MTLNHSKPKVLIIFPRYSGSESSHYPYWYKLFNKAAKDLDIAIIFESGSRLVKPKNLENISQWVIQSQTQKPWNLFERYRLVRKYVEQGYTNIYIHYSYWSVILSWYVKFISPRSSQITIFYWNCERFDVKPKEWLLILSLKLCDVLVTGHQVIANSYRQIFKLGDKPINIVPNWVEESSALDKTNTSNSQNSKSHLAPTAHILFVHHLSPRKGSRDLPQIISDVLEKIPYTHFHIVGEGPDKKWLNSKITLMNLTENVTLFGNLPLKQVQKMYHQMDLFIMPSRAEGFPRVILEAMIHKIPFVATKVGCVEAIVSGEQLPYLVDRGNIKHFSQLTIKLLKMSKLQIKRLLDSNQHKAYDYSLKNSSTEFENQFSQS